MNKKISLNYVIWSTLVENCDALGIKRDVLAFEKLTKVIESNVRDHLRKKSLWFKLKLFTCKYLGWHNAPTKVSFDGCSLGGKCSTCGKDVLQDSQGNWF